MSYREAKKIVKNHPELVTEMVGVCDFDWLISCPQEEFNSFYCDYVSMAVENNPSLLD